MEEKAYLGEWLTDQYPMRCVVCGKSTDIGEEDQCKGMGIPGGCLKHITRIFEEAFEGHSMWPSGWYGHWWKRNISDAD